MDALPPVYKFLWLTSSPACLSLGIVWPGYFSLNTKKTNTVLETCAFVVHFSRGVQGIELSI